MKKHIVRIAMILLGLVFLIIISYKIITRPYKQSENTISSFYNISNSSEQITNIDEVPIKFRKSFLFFFDKDFYKHKGLKKDFISYYFASKFQTFYGGPSANRSLSQIISDIVFFNGEHFPVTLSHVISSLRLDKTLKKDEIFLLVINSIDFSKNIYGLENASTYYFHNAFYNLTDPEIVFLTVMARIAVYNKTDINFCNKIFTDTQERLIEQKIISDTLTSEEIKGFIDDYYK